MATASSFLATSPSRPSLGAFSPPALSAKLPSRQSSACNGGKEGRRRGRLAMSSSPAEVEGGERYYGPTSKPLLDSVHSPADMKRFSINELKQLAYELRWETLEVSASIYCLLCAFVLCSCAVLPCMCFVSLRVHVELFITGGKSEMGMKMCRRVRWLRMGWFLSCKMWCFRDAVGTVYCHGTEESQSLS